MPQYTVLDNLSHDGKPYATGDEVELTQAEAKPLIEVRVIAPKPKDKKPTEVPKQ